MNKGDFGYIDSRKKRQLIAASLSMLMVVIICMTGIILYHTQKSLFAVIAALAALPAAKILVGYIVIMPYKSVGEDVRAKLSECAGDMENCRILYDVVLSSPEKSMTAGVVYIKNGKIYGFTEYYSDEGKGKRKKEKQKGKQISVSDVEKHMRFIVDANCNYSAIKVFEDERRFLAAVKNESACEKDMTADELTRMRNMNERIENQLKIYMF